MNFIYEDFGDTDFKDVVRWERDIELTLLREFGLPVELVPRGSSFTVLEDQTCDKDPEVPVVSIPPRDFDRATTLVRCEAGWWDHDPAVERWPEVVPFDMTQRRVGIITGANLRASVAPYADSAGRIFLKSLHKNWHGLGGTDFDGLMEATQGALYYLDESDKLIVSEPLDINRDALGTLEWRFFVLDGEVVCGSRQSDNPAAVGAWAPWGVARNFAARLPFTRYTLDLASTNRGIVVVELNGYEAAGRYATNWWADIVGRYYPMLKQAMFNRERSLLEECPCPDPT
jgi:hypothetical protein